MVPLLTDEVKLDKAYRIIGWMSEGELKLLGTIAQKCKVIIEVGSYYGKSTRALADNSPDDARIYAVDPWDYYFASLMKVDNNSFNQFYMNLYEYIKSKKLIICRAKWEDYEPKEKADFIFIDGDHTYDSCRHDIDKALQWVKPDGIIAGHDYNVAGFPGVKQAVDETFPNVDYLETIWYKVMR
jgi:predicted O-methyltransferase YrrM